MSLWTKCKIWLLGIIFPPLCLQCRAHLSSTRFAMSLCEPCEASIPIYQTFFCGTCKARLPDNIKTCHQDTPFLLAAATSYQHDGVKNLLWHFKYQKWQRLQQPLTQLLARYFRNLRYSFEEYLIIPIPLHPTREKERGFNQAHLLAKNLGKILSLPLNTTALIRTQKTHTQKELRDYTAREQNVAQAFMVTNAEQIKNKNIILVDDVYTSGATMTAAARTLKAAGAKKIIGCVIAKT